MQDYFKGPTGNLTRRPWLLFKNPRFLIFSSNGKLGKFSDPFKIRIPNFQSKNLKDDILPAQGGVSPSVRQSNGLFRYGSKL